MRKLDPVLYYSVLKYTPSAIRLESINVGIAVHYPSGKFSHFFETKNKRRIRAFDDEYDPDFFKMVMDSLAYDLDYGKKSDVSTLNLNFPDEAKRFKNITKKDFLDSRISYLANEFRFSPIQSMSTNDEELDKDINDLKDMYLYYDKPKKGRITKEKIKSIVSKQLHSYNLSNMRKINYKDDFGGTEVYDFKINNILLGTMTFDYSNINYLSKELKVILYDLNKVKHNSDISNIFLIRNDNLGNKAHKQIYNEFKSQIQVIENKNKSKISVFPPSELKQALDKEA